MAEMLDLSVQELSNRTGKSIQSIYKRIKNKNDVIHGFLKRDNKGNIIEPVRIYENVIDVIYNKKSDIPKLNPKPSLVEPLGENKESPYLKTIEVLQEQLNLLQVELSAEREDKKQKDKLIFELTERLAESQRNLDQQQQLSALDKKRILALEEKNARPLHRRLLDVFRKKEGDKK